MKNIKIKKKNKSCCIKSEEYFFILRNEIMGKKLLPTGSSREAASPTSRAPGLQDESWRKPVASGALQVGYLPPG